MTHSTGGGGGRLDKFVGKKIFNVDEIKNLEFDKIFIANQHYKTLEEVLNLGIPNEKIVVAVQPVYNEYKSKNPDGTIQFALMSVLTEKLYTKKFSNEKLSSLNGNLFTNVDDYVRTGTLQLLAEEVQTRNVPGELAELGVFQGEFSKYLNELFPDRTLNLFDTFEGFDKKDEQLDLQNGYSDQSKIDSARAEFPNTSVDLVMSKMKYPEKIEVHRGYFPDTIPAEEKTFALVSIDCDLYKPTLEGLRYFYPRLSIGGFIMIHDYNGLAYADGIHKAVDDFEKEFGHIVKFPIPDMAGTLVIGK